VGRKRGITVSKILRLKKLAFFTVAVLGLALCVVTPSQAAPGGGGYGFSSGHPGGAAGHPGFHGHPEFHGNPGFHGQPFHHFGHDRFVFGFGGVVPYYGYYDYPPAYAYPAPGYWYYCPSYGTYYPYVTSCPESWVPVPAS